MNKLTKLTIKKFRNVEPTTLEFSPGLNVLLGRNAAGKTTLLRLLSTATTTSEEGLKDDAFEVSYLSFSSEGLDFEHAIKKERASEPVLPPGLGRPTGEEFPSLQRKDSFVFFDQKTHAIILKAEILPNEVVIEREGQKFPKEHAGTKMEFSQLIYFALVSAEPILADHDLANRVLNCRIQSTNRMDESLGQLEALLKLQVTVLGNGYRFSAHDIPHSMYGIMRKTWPEGTSANFSFEFLDRAARVLGYDSATARLDMERLSSEPNLQKIRLSNLRFFFKRTGEEISHDLLSYGQKRLLAFFAHADTAGDVIIADELVNGLHHEWITACLDEIGNRQAFLTSQNPLLLDFLRFESAEEVRRTFILCERVQHESGARLVWRNPSEEEAESFFAAYQTGIQRVSDILLTKGLW